MNWASGRLLVESFGFENMNENEELYNDAQIELGMNNGTWNHLCKAEDVIIDIGL